MSEKTSEDASGELSDNHTELVKNEAIQFHKSQGHEFCGLEYHNHMQYMLNIAEEHGVKDELVKQLIWSHDMLEMGYPKKDFCYKLGKQLFVEAFLLRRGGDETYREYVDTIILNARQHPRIVYVKLLDLRCNLNAGAANPKGDLISRYLIAQGRLMATVVSSLGVRYAGSIEATVKELAKKYFTQPNN